jgi:hypothetical protein
MTAQRCDVLGGIYARLGVIAGDVTGIEVLRPCMRYLVEHPACVHVTSISDERRPRTSKYCCTDGWPY